MRRVKYIHGYGYLIQKSGRGIMDSFTRIIHSVPKQIMDAGKDALTNVGSSTIKALASKVGDKIADRIMKKPKVKKAVKELSDESDTSFGFSPEVYKKLYGNGIKKGRGIKILV